MVEPERLAPTFEPRERSDGQAFAGDPSADGGRLVDTHEDITERRAAEARSRIWRSTTR